jgi:hypothetical protein
MPRLTPKGREEMVRAVVEGGLNKAAAIATTRYAGKNISPRWRCCSHGILSSVAYLFEGREGSARDPEQWKFRRVSGAENRRCFGQRGP